MLQRPLHDIQFQTLYQENSMLRERLKKMNEIEPYVEILLENNKKYQFEVNDLQTENHRLRCKIDEITEQSLRLKQSNSSQISILKNNFQTDIDKLLKQLRQIVRDKDAMQHANQLLIQELQTKYRRDLQNRRLGQQTSQRDLSSKISKLSEMLRQNQKILQDKIWSFSNKEQEYLRQNQKLQIDKNNLQREVSLLKEQNIILSNQKQILVKKNKELNRENQETAKKWLKSQQDKSQTILQIKDNNKQLLQQNQNLNAQVRLQQKNINQLNRRVVNLTRECEDVCIKNNDLEATLRRVARSKTDIQSQQKQTRQKLQILAKNSNEQLCCQAQQIDKLSDQNKILLKENALLNSECNDKTSEIGDLLTAVQNLENKLNETNKKFHNSQSDNNKLNTHIKKLEQSIDQLSLECKSLNQKVLLYVKHNQTLQKMLEKQKRKNINLETSRYQIQNLALGAINKPQQICKQYERQIQKMVHEFVQQRRVHQERNLAEINTMRATYEAALKQKQQYFDRKIIFLQKQLGELRRIG